MPRKKKNEAPPPDSDSEEDGNIGDVSAVGVFVNHQMILKVFPEQEMEGAFRAAYKDFKSECLSFLKQVEEKDDLEVRHYQIADPYTMFYSEVGDKEAVFLMSGNHENGFPATEALHLAVTGIIDSLQNATGDILKKGKNNNDDDDGDRGKKYAKLRPGRRASRRSSLVGFSSIEEVFRTMDLDGSGSIDEAEFSTGLGVLGVDWKDSQVKKLFNQIDDENNGVIGFDAFMRFMMKPSNKKSWKELKRAINSSIAMPSVKSIKESSISPELYQKKLSQMEKLVNMMEEAMVEQQLPAEEQKYWKNKILAHREFIRRHQDVVGRAMGQDNSRLKKRLNDLEKKNRRLSEIATSMGIDPNDTKSSSSRKKRGGKRSGSVQLPSVGRDDDSEALIKRLRRDNEEYKRKIQQQQGDLRKLQQESKRRGSTTPRSASRRGTLNIDDKQMEEMLSKLKKENYELRNERNELRKERDSLLVQLKALKDKVSKLEKLGGDDEELLAQLYKARKEAQKQRKDKNALRAEALQLKGIDNALRRKLMALAKRVTLFDVQMGTAIRSKTTANGMIDELAEQLTAMIEKYEKAVEEIKKLKKRLREQAKQHEEELQKKKEKIAELKRKLKERDNKIYDMQDQLREKDEDIENLREDVEQLKQFQKEAKEYKKKIGSFEDERAEFERMRETYQMELSEAKKREKNLKKQLKMIEKMPGNASMLKKIDRLHKMFTRLDKDGDGYLNFEDFQVGAADLGFGETLEEQRAAFEAMDKDEDGFIDFEDFKQACLRNMERSADKSDEEWKMTYKLLSKPPSKWNNEDVNLWLSHIGMDQYGEEFENMDGNMLINMKQQKDLKDWGVQKNAHVRKMMREIKDLKARDDLLSNLHYENEQLKSDLDNMNKNGPTWKAVHTLQRKIRDLDGQVRKEKYGRENIMINVKDALKNDKRFDNISPDYEDVLAEVALLKGALADANQKLTNKNKNNKPISGSAYDNDASPEQALKNYGQPIGRFLQKWYVLANHSTQYWISRTNQELNTRDEHYKKLKEARKNKKKKQNTNDQSDDDDDKYNDDDDDDDDDEDDIDDEEYTESLDWILFDTRQKRLISELRVQGRGAPNDPKEIELQMSASPSGPWTTVKEHEMQNNGQREKIGGFEAEARFWRVAFMSNYGEKTPSAPRYVLYECQFWGPLDDDVENTHFVIE